MKLTFLGTGTSHGIPVIGCACDVCRSRDPRDRRMRPAVSFREGGRRWIIDTPPELRLQCLAHGIDRIEGVLLTHGHADHIFGMDDLRRFCEIQGKAIPVYGSPETLRIVRETFRYCFQPPIPGLSRPRLDLRPLGPVLEAPPFRIRVFDLPHGPGRTSGYLVEGTTGRMAYFTDCSDVPDDAVEAVRGVDVLVLDALRRRPHPSHLSLEQAVEIAGRIAPGRAYLTHLCHDLSHEAVERDLPSRVRLAYDGLEIDLKAGGT